MAYNLQITAAICAAGALFQVGTAEAQTPQMGGTAIFTMVSDPLTFAPSISTNVPDRQTGCIIYQGLITVDNDYKVNPLLAKSWTISPDGLTYTFELNKAEWHDGKPFTSEDVKYTIEEISSKMSSIFRPAGEAIDKIETPAPDKIVFKLKQSFGPFMISLGCIQGVAVMPAHLMKGTDPKTNPATLSNPVGTGPFKFQEWKRGDNVRLVKNTKYFEPGKPYLDGVIGKVIGSAGARTSALAAGEVDLVQSMPSNDKAAIEANAKLKVENSDIAPNSSLGFLNIKRKPLDNKEVRKALFIALDRDYIFKNATFNIGKVGTQPFTTAIGWAANPDIDYRKMYPFDTAKANAMLDAAGMKRGADGKRFKLVLVQSTQYPEFEQTAIAMKSMWSQIGVDVQIDGPEPAVYIKRVHTDGDFDVALNVYTSYSDPALGVSRTWQAAMIGKPFGNASTYTDPRVEELFNKGQAAVTNEERGKFYKEAQVILADDLPVFMMREYRPIDGATKKLKGLWNVAQGQGSWQDAWLEK